MRPRIGITSWHYRDDDERWEAVLEDYSRAVFDAGGLPLILPIPRIESALVDAYLEAIDGLILTGGADIHPSFYGQIVLEQCGEIDEERDRFEVELIHAARSRDLPLLGICRGLQVINVALGGSLYQDLSYRQETDSIHQSLRERRGELVHEVAIVESSRLADILGIRKLDVTSTHHQIICNLAPGLTINAVAPDGVIEGIEDAGRFLLAVHWHPERMITRHPEQLELFQALVEEAARSPRFKVQGS
ncbi:MAG: gamma-glutamyl-gamma-aminobutyrate hydrolase family protein [bacterium]|uniref:Gamma-glutamyl-gamma-aminobutyrate hydrolase family protein n=1 Tax=Candidatus Methylomirabilis tolerans TaxID=3123416 RepID=A0AAJ1AJB2_9BACT|nr:gamma-glutamyl-gamma-aminobutyrate hydrolase family protein [Candidatus Methylomirabilis sp.]